MGEETETPYDIYVGRISKLLKGINQYIDRGNRRIRHNRSKYKETPIYPKVVLSKLEEGLVGIPIGLNIMPTEASFSVGYFQELARLLSKLQGFCKKEGLYMTCSADEISISREPIEEVHHTNYKEPFTRPKKSHYGGKRWAV